MENAGWYRIDIPPNDFSSGSHLERLFDILFTSKASTIKDAALLERRDGTATGRYVYYISPAASQFSLSLIRDYSGVECPAPLSSEVKPCIAHADWEKFILLA